MLCSFGRGERARMFDDRRTFGAASALTAEDLLALADSALAQANALLSIARQRIVALVAPQGVLDPSLLNREQMAAHGFAWYATYACALRQMCDWGTRLAAANRFGSLEQAMLLAAFGEYLAQMVGGVPLSQGEIVRPADLGLDHEAMARFRSGPVATLIEQGAHSSIRLDIARLVADSLASERFGAMEEGAETLQELREHVRRFVDKSVTPYAHGWHLANALIPMEVIEQLAELGVFGITIGAEYGGLDLGKLAMCVATEELSRGYIGVGSLGTRAEIAAELIATGGTEAQRLHWLPRIAAGKVLATAVFTEPNTGSDLGSLTTRAVKEGNTYRVTGSKTWITHASRADLMILLARTDPGTPGHAGLSILLAPKQPGTEAAHFPDTGLEGTEIAVLGYRGMREYELGFDGFVVPAEGLLGQREGLGFKQLMTT